MHVISRNIPGLLLSFRQRPIPVLEPASKAAPANPAARTNAWQTASDAAKRLGPSFRSNMAEGSVRARVALALHSPPMEV